MSMDRTTVVKRAGYYYETLEKLAAFPLWKNVTIKDVDPSRGVMQKAYSEMNQTIYGRKKDEKFGGSIIDYFCWVSLMFILLLWQNYREVDEDIEIEITTGKGKVKKIGISPSGMSSLHMALQLRVLDDVHVMNMCRLYLSDTKWLNQGLVELYGIGSRNTEPSFVDGVSKVIEERIGDLMKYKRLQ
jgi:hypothetical protein